MADLDSDSPDPGGGAGAARRTTARSCRASPDASRPNARGSRRRRLPATPSRSRAADRESGTWACSGPRLRAPSAAVQEQLRAGPRRPARIAAATRGRHAARAAARADRGALDPRRHSRLRVRIFHDALHTESLDEGLSDSERAAGLAYWIGGLARRRSSGAMVRPDRRRRAQPRALGCRGTSTAEPRTATRGRSRFPRTRRRAQAGPRSRAPCRTGSTCASSRMAQHAVTVHGARDPRRTSRGTHRPRRAHGAADRGRGSATHRRFSALAGRLRRGRAPGDGGHRAAARAGSARSAGSSSTACARVSIRPRAPGGWRTSSARIGSRTAPSSSPRERRRTTPSPRAPPGAGALRPARPTCAAARPSTPARTPPVTARALGLRPEAPGPCPMRATREQSRAAAFNTALWTTTWGDAIEHLTPQGRANGDQRLDSPALDAVREHWVANVRGRGPLPVLRLGRQPYGLLPLVEHRRGLAPTPRRVRREPARPFHRPADPLDVARRVRPTCRRS